MCIRVSRTGVLPVLVTITDPAVLWLTGVAGKDKAAGWKTTVSRGPLLSAAAATPRPVSRAAAAITAIAVRQCRGRRFGGSSRLSGLPGRPSVCFVPRSPGS